jgi:hypothetical protein
MFDGSGRTETNQTVSGTHNGARVNGDSPRGSGLRIEKDGWRGSDEPTCGTSMDPEIYFEDLRKLVAPLRERLLTHSIYAEVNSLNRLREFMRIHVFAVWDFMSLVKRLQGELTTQDLPWTPPARPEIARFANEVVLGEETDLSLDGKPLSHFELYLRAMDELGVETVDIRASIASVGRGASWEAALNETNAPQIVTDFVSETLRCAIYGSVVEVASYFFFGREDVIPEMFKKLLALWREGAVEVPHFAFYLERHIELDGDSHGPWARQMLTALAGMDEEKWMEASRAAQQALSNRIKLWDGVVAHLKDIA